MDNQHQLSEVSQSLPVEIIIKILSYVNHKDLKTCRLVSKQFYDLIRTTSELIKKLKFVVQFSTNISKKETWKQRAIDINNNSTYQVPSGRPLYRPNDLIGDATLQVPQPLNFENIKGPFIRNIILKLNNFDEFSWNFMKELPNLEDLSIEETRHVTYDFIPAQEDPIDLSKLTSLKLTQRLLNSFTSSTKNVNNLKALTIKVTSEDHQELLTDFIVQQDNLKELYLNIDPLIDSINFPATDITSKIKFQLTKFKLTLSAVRNESQHFQQFFESQAGHLESLKLNFNPDDQLLTSIFTKCTNLKHFGLKLSPRSDSFSRLDQELQMPSVRSIKDRFIDDQKITLITARFPNVRELQCGLMRDIHGCFDKIRKISVESLFCHTMGDCAFPNLKELYINNAYGFRDKAWRQFHKNIMELEQLKIAEIC
ncbi:unnamed protein product [Chironomus riparius]|uniref:F-box domain-containing protein n=1 Tax=Chironomus riparius TaxID=315576 RepID=A0A9N9S8I1_9DIPT|nr:unnamed protein product [Chironomus riparius]